MMTIKGGSNKACAACKYQRRRCSKECPVAPYFPSDQPKKFSNAHRLFGVANIKKILDKVEPWRRDEAMKSIIFESDMREKFPVMGCLGLLLDYNHQIVAAMEELRYLQLGLAIYRKQFHYYISHQISPSTTAESMPASVYADTLSMSSKHLQHENNEDVMFEGGDGNEVFDLKPSFSSMSAQWSNFIINQPEINTVEYDGINPYDDRQLLIEYKEETCKPSKESSLREAKCHMERASTTELKSAAANLGLTTVEE